MSGHTAEDIGASTDHVFDQFVSAVTCKSILASFDQLLDLTGLRHADHTQFYQCLKAKLKLSWKAQSLWAKLDKRAAHRDYKRGQACKDLRVLIIGSGPCGLRTAIECALLGARTVVVEKRDRFSRNNVLHLWPYLITDLRNLGAKKFFGKFCAGAIDHISIRQLQCILLKVALLLGVEVHVNVTFEGLIEPPVDQSSGVGWKCGVSPQNHAVAEYEFDVLIGADGKRNTLPGFSRKEFRGKLAIAVTANFINRNTQAEARVEEISGVAFIFNQKFFLDLKESTRIDLENIVYYKDDTHYFVMTAKKASLLQKGVLKEDFSDTVALLDRANVNQEALMAYAREAADFSTNYMLPSLDYAVNHYGQADVAMFDFTSMFAAENASRLILKNGHHMLMGLVGDSLLEPFWPTGSGCARGFLGAFDAAWMIRNWASGKFTPLQVLAERESIYTVLSQTTPNYLHKNHSQYSIDPNTRYPNLNTKCIKGNQIRHLYEGGEFKEEDEEEVISNIPAMKARSELSIDSYSLLRWCQRVLNTGKYRGVHIVDLTSSWRSGLALCALIHTFRPDIINVTTLMESEVLQNNSLAFSVAEKELGISPVLSAEEMAKKEIPDKLTMVAYLSQFYELFKQDSLPLVMPLPVRSKRKSMARDGNKPKSPRSPNRRVSFLQKLSARLAKSKKRKEQEENEERSPLGSKKLKERPQKMEVELTSYNKLPMEEIANRLQLDRPPMEAKVKPSKASEEMMGAVSVTAMADLLVAKFKGMEDKPVPEPVRKLKSQVPPLLAASAASEFCSFCHKRVYIMERMSAEGEFFHRHCFRCDHCGLGLRLSNYSCDREVKPVKFYCYRHTLPEQRVRPARKRSLQEEVKENVPITVIPPVPEVDTGQASKEKSPRKAPPVHLTPLRVPGEVMEKPGKTPERVEFEISFDGQEEESEEEQFEHNLRASLSSDTLLDEDDTDSDLSDSDVESGAEEEIWESTVESPQSPGSPLTYQQAKDLVGSLRDQLDRQRQGHSYSTQRTRNSSQGYQRLTPEEAGEDDEGSSTEVEEESEYETGESSAEEDEEEESEEDTTEPSKSEGSKTPTSPLSRLSASKASFFSEPPKVVSLDPWSMFGMGNKKQPQEEEKAAVQPEVEKKAKTTPKKKSESSKRKKSSDASSESKSVSSARKKSLENMEARKPSLKDNNNVKDAASLKDTDISDSLEMDSRSGREEQASLSEGGGRTRHSTGGSLDELREELSPDLPEQYLTLKGGEVKLEERAGDFLQYSQPLQWETDEDDLSDREAPKGKMEEEEEEGKGSEGDDEEEKMEGEELLEKTAVSQAMEQLLRDIDHKSFSMDQTPVLGDTTESEENEVFVEGRLSPSASKTRKFRMKRHRRSMERRSSRAGRTSTSEGEAARTDPTTTDNSCSRSSVSRSPSAELEKLMVFPNNQEAAVLPLQSGVEAAEQEVSTPTVALPVDDIPVGDSQNRKTSDIEDAALKGSEVESGMMQDVNPSNEAKKDVTAETLSEQVGSVVVEKKSLSEPAEDVTVREEESIGLDSQALTTGDDDTLRQLLESVAAMPDLSDNSDIDDLVLTNVDDKFVTDRRGKRKKPKGKAATKTLVSKAQSSEGVNSSFSISTPSGSESPVSSMEEGEMGADILVTNPGEEDLKPDEDMMRDYHTTMSLALGESYSDEEEGKEEEEAEKDDEQKGGKEKEGGSIGKGNDKPEEPLGTTEVEMCENESGAGSKNGVDFGEGADHVVTDSELRRDSSLYITPEVSMEKEREDEEEEEEASVLVSSPARPLPIPRPAAALSQGHESLTVPTSDPHGPKFTKTPVPTSTSPPPNNDVSRDSSGSEMFISPVESFPQSLQIAPTSALPPSPLVSTPVSSKPVSKDSILKGKPLPLSTPPPPPASSSSLSSPPFPSSSVPSSKSSAPETTKNSDTPSPVSKPARTHRKLPDLPKLNIPPNSKVKATPPPLTAGPTAPPPAMCSSPKPSKRVPAPPLVFTPELKRPVRPLPTPSSSTASVSKSGGVSANKGVVARPSPASASSKDFSFSKPAVKPVSPPIFRPPAKTVVPLDKSKLKLGLTADSDAETRKKKIPAEGIVIEKDIDDIPFADESEAEEKFYTPRSTTQRDKPDFPSHANGLSTRKRILPSPPSASKAEAGVLSPDQIREIRRQDMEKAKMQARERARLKSDEELGLTPTKAMPESPTSLVSAKVQEEERSRRSASYDTPSTSDVLSDSDDTRLSVQSPPSSAAEAEQTPPTQPPKKEEKKKKVKTGKKRKEKKEKKEKEGESEKKRKSLLALILPGKTDKSSKEHLKGSSDSTPRGSDDNTQGRSAKSGKGKEKKRGEVSYAKSASVESLDKTPTAEGKSALAICSVFSSGQGQASRPSLGVRRTIPVAPKASVDELSDSDESHISFNTMQRRLDEDLDERVARRLRRIQQRQQKQAEQKRLRMAQEIQRQLEEVEERQRELEQKGVAVEMALRGDGPEGEDVDESQLMSEWFTLVHEKNALLRYESELNVRARELELEDRQTRLENNFRERARNSGSAPKTESELNAEGQLLDELLDVVEQRNSLVSMLEEDRLREQKEDKELKDMMIQKGFVLSPLSYDMRRERQKLEAPLAPLTL